MKISLKQILAVGALAVASTSAFADISLPNAGNGELTLVVWDQTTNTSYVRGLGVTLDQIATTSAIAADGSYSVGSTVFNISVAFNLSADANLSSFLAGAAPTDTVTWGVIGGAVTGSGNVTGVKRYVTTTSATAAGVAGATTNAKITSQYSNLQAWDTQFSGHIEDDNGGNTTIGNMQSSSNAGFTSVMSTWAGALSATNQVALGSSANFYLLSSAQGTTGTAARVYQLSGLTLSSSGTLTGGPAATPIPAAFWLLGSGLAGLVGIGRRKNIAA